MKKDPRPLSEKGISRGVKIKKSGVLGTLLLCSLECTVNLTVRSSDIREVLSDIREELIGFSEDPVGHASFARPERELVLEECCTQHGPLHSECAGATLPELHCGWVCMHSLWRDPHQVQHSWENNFFEPP